MVQSSNNRLLNIWGFSSLKKKIDPFSVVNDGELIFFDLDQPTNIMININECSLPAKLLVLPAKRKNELLIFFC